MSMILVSQASSFNSKHRSTMSRFQIHPSSRKSHRSVRSRTCRVHSSSSSPQRSSIAKFFSGTQKSKMQSPPSEWCISSLNRKRKSIQPRDSLTVSQHSLDSYYPVTKRLASTNATSDSSFFTPDYWTHL